MRVVMRECGAAQLPRQHAARAAAIRLRRCLLPCRYALMPLILLRRHVTLMFHYIVLLLPSFTLDFLC